MERCSVKARWEFVDTIRDHVQSTTYNGIDIREFARKLLRYGATLGRIAENQCNGYQTWDHKWDEHSEKRDEAKEKRIQERVTILCERFNCKPDFKGDPRGNTLKIIVPDGYTNDWGRTGICVPTS